MCTDHQEKKAKRERDTCGDDVGHEAAVVAQGVQAGPRVVGGRAVHVVRRDVVAHGVGRHLRLPRVVRRIRAHLAVVGISGT